MQIPFSPPDIREEDIEAVVEVLRSGWITSGPVGEDFRQALTKYCGSSDTILVNSATAGLEVALRLLGVGSGDEVVVPAYTYSASAAVIKHVGAQIVMVDVTPGEFFPSPQIYAEAITERTKAIIPVDLGGVPVDLAPIYTAIESAKAKFVPKTKVQDYLGRVAIIADGAHSLGAVRNGQRTGNLADFTSFSFHAVKNLTTAEGGALTWSRKLSGISDELMKYARLLILHGQSKSALEKNNSAAWEYDIAFPGFKQNMADIMAALGHSQLKRYEQTLVRRREIVEHYNEAFTGLNCSWLEHSGFDWQSSCHLYLLRLNGVEEVGRNRFIDEMYNRGVSCNVHYKPLPMFTGYRDLGFDIVNYPNAFAQYQNEVSLPLHTCLTDEQVEYLVQKMSDCIKGI